MGRLIALLLFLACPVKAQQYLPGITKISPTSAVPIQSTVTLSVTIDSGQSDAFGRVRVAEPNQIFESQLQYGLEDLVWHSSVAAIGGSNVHLSSRTGVEMSVNGVSGAFAIRQSREYLRYQPGKSQFILLTAVVGSSATNVVKEWGYGDRYNGIFFRQTDAGLFFVIRSTAGGVFTERAVAQAGFNGDKMDGTGASRFAVNLSSGNIYWIDFEWLGVGEVRMGVVADHRIILAHTFKNSNAFGNVYMATANLPIRYLIKNVGASSGSSILQICSSVLMEGGNEPRGIPFSTGTYVTTSVTTRRPILSIRPRARFGGLENRAKTLPEHYEVMAENSKSAFCEIVQGGTLTGASFNAVDPNSHTESDYQATTISGGQVVDTMFVPASGAGPTMSGIENKGVLTIGYNADSPDNFSIVCTAIGTAVTLNSAVHWQEYR